MIPIDPRDWEESQREKLDEAPEDYLEAEDAVDFIFHIKDTLHPMAFQDLLSSWLKTKQGEAWYARILDRLVRDCPENDEDLRVDR